MKKLLAIVLCAIMMFTLCACSSGAEEPKTYANKLEKILDEGVLTIATSPDFAPSEFLDISKTGQDSIVGADISLAYYIAEELGVELVIEAMDFTAVQAAVTQGSVDMGISGFAATEERKESMNLSDFYNLNTRETKGHGIIMLAENAANYTNPEDFAGLTIGAQNASLQMNLLTAQVPEATPQPITSLDTAILEVINGKVDGLAVSWVNGESYIANYPELAMTNFHFDYTSDGTVIAMKKGEDELTAKVNEILEKGRNTEGLFQGWYDDAVALAESLGIN